MPKPGEHKTVQSRIITYAQEIGWKFVSGDEAETRRCFNNHSGKIQEKAAQASIYFNDILYQKVREFNPKYSEAQEMVKPHGFVLDFVGIFDNKFKTILCRGNCDRFFEVGRINDSQFNSIISRFLTIYTAISKYSLIDGS
ncbi:hypothetical protein [Nostoc sp.]|uniref:hypothetical protein n=1 Tax=Nostoc sp. TaxID=1180 RepID=UPI002FF8B5F6